MIIWYFCNDGGVDTSKYSSGNLYLLYTELGKRPEPSDCVWLVPGTVDPMAD